MLTSRQLARRARLAGSLAVALAIALAELLAGMLDGVNSMVISIGTFFVDYSPGWLESFAIRTFGTNDKLVLSVAITVVTLLTSTHIGTVARKRFSDGAQWLVALGVIGTLASLAQPLTSAGLVLATGVIVTVAAVAALRQLLAALDAATPVEPTGSGDVAIAAESARAAAGRREFMGIAGGVAAASAFFAAFGRSLLASRRPAAATTFSLAEASAPAAPIGSAASFAVEGLAPIIIPNEDFYRIDAALVVPRVDPGTWRLRIHGLVDREVSFTLDELNAMPLVEQYVTIACVSNEVGGDLVGNAKWRGVPLRDLLDRAGVQPGAEQIVGRSVDDWTGGFPVEAGFDDRDALLAIGMNDEPLPLAHGFPARLIVPGLYGYVSATKWISEIELTTWDGFDGYWIPRGWAKKGPVKTQSRIDVPSSGQRFPRGPVTIAGVAWAPTRGLTDVEVRVDGGAWQAAELTTPLSESAWVQWRTQIEVSADSHIVECRATDGTGAPQGETRVAPRPDGAEGYHRIRVFATN